MKSAGPHTNNGFTLVELLATIAILATLSVVSLIYIGNYITWSQKNANGSTLAALNTALQEYKTLGGMKVSHSLQGTNYQTKIDAIIAALKNGITIYNQKKSFLNKDVHIASTMVYGRSEGKYFSFSGYGVSQAGAVTGSFAGSYAAKPASPPPSGVGILTHASGTFTFPNITTSTGYFAYKVDSSTIRTSTHGGNKVTTDTGASVSFWACPSLADSSVSGNITVLSLANTNISSFDFRSLLALSNVNLSGCASLTSIDLSNHTSLTTFNAGGAGPSCITTSINLSGCSNWSSGSMDFWNSSLDNIQTIDLSGCSSIVNPLSTIEYHGSVFTTLDVTNCSSITSLGFLNYFQPLTTLKITGCTGLTNLTISGTKISSVDLTTSPNLAIFSASNAPIASINFSSNLALTNVNVSGCKNLAIVDLHGHTALTTINAGGAGTGCVTTSIDLSGCSNWSSGSIDFWASSLDNVQSINISGCSSIATPFISLEYHGNNFTTLNISGCSSLTTLNLFSLKFSASTLNQIYTDLPTCSGTITVTNNPGASSDTPSIATGKGWTVVGS